MLNRKGFTLIELLIVVVIIGILAAIAIPKFASTKEKAYLASMKSDLRNGATAQEGYFADNQVYLSGNASNLAGVATPLVALGNFVPSAGVSITFTAAAGTGWNAVTTHSATAKTCDIFIGTAPGSAGVATVEGEPKCTP